MVSSTIKPELLRRALFRGTVVAGLAALLLVLSGIFFPLSILRFWGLPIFLIALILIGFGLYPYKMLSKLVLKPHQLVKDETTLHFLEKGTPLLEIPLVSIEEMGYVEKGYLYGLAIRLKHPPPEKIKILRDNVALERFLREKDIFLPYFSKESVQSLDK